MPYNFVCYSFHTGVTAEALRVKINRKSAISHRCGHFDPKFQVQGVAPPPIIFAWLVGPINAFILGSLESAWRTSYLLAVTAEALRAIIGLKSAISLQRGPVDPKFQVEGVVAHQPFSSQKIRINVLSYGIKIWTDRSSVLSQCTRVTDRRRDRQNSHH